MARKRGEFSQWLDLTLKEKGISGRELAAQLGVHEGKVSKWRVGAREPNPREVSKLAEVLDVNPFRLIVTAGLLEPQEGVEPLPFPEEDPRRKAIRERLADVLSAEELQAQLDAFDRNQRRVGRRVDGSGETS